MSSRSRFICLLLIGMLATSAVSAQDKSVKPGINDSFRDPDPKEFQGRFEIESREVFARRKEILTACQIKPGQTVADIGAGTGLFTRLFSDAVDKNGRVMAVDISQKFLNHIQTTSRSAGQLNVETVLCKDDSTELANESVDVAFICDTYHHFEFPLKTMTSLHRALKPEGRIILIDFRRVSGKSSDWVMTHVRAGQEVFESEVIQSGFRKTREVADVLKENYFVEFIKESTPKSNSSPVLADVAADVATRRPSAIPLWINGAPGSEARANEAEELVGENCGNVHNPTLTPYVPAAENATGTAVIICPGGGHSKLCLGHEGYALAEWFRDRGIAAFVLKYRLAREKGSSYTIQEHAMADTRRALRLVRSRAADWHLKTDRIGILGFSAGGELAAYAAMKHDDGQKDSTDVIEQQSCRPNFQGLIYPGSSGTFTVETGMPPAFIAAGINDRPDISEGMANLYLKYKAAKVPAELHLFANIGHGFGYRHNAKPSAAARWPERFTEWLIDTGLLTPPEIKQP